MTGKQTVYGDATGVLYSWSRGPGTAAQESGSRTARLEITIDFDKLVKQLKRDAMSAKGCKITRLQGAIKVRPVKGTLITQGEGRPL